MFGLFLGALWLLVLRLWLQAHLFLNADTLSVPDVWASLRAGGRLGDWSMGNHAFIFPDLAFYQVAAWCTPGLAERQVAYGLLQGFLAWWLGSKLASRLFDLELSSARACTAAGLIVGVVFLKAESGLGQWFFPSHHGGALLASLALSSWVLAQRQPSSWFKVLWMGTFCALTHASDAVFTTWALVPAFCLSLPLGWAARRRVWTVIGLSFGLKALLQAYWKSQGMKLLHFRWDYFLQHSRQLLEQARLQSGAFASDYALSLGLALVLALFLLSRWRRELAQACFALAWFALLTAAIALAALQGQLAGRYLAWCLWVPAMLGPAYLASRWPTVATGLVAVAAALGFFWLTLFRPALPADRPEQRQAAWLDAQLAQRGVSQGWADYWHARPLQLFSRQNAQLIPVISDWGEIQAFEWVSRRQVFAWDRELKHPQFVVLNGLDQAKVRARVKAKPQLVEGEGLQVWFFGPALKTGDR
jgi:hypothetical protein